MERLPTSNCLPAAIMIAFLFGPADLYGVLVGLGPHPMVEGAGDDEWIAVQDPAVGKTHRTAWIRRVSPSEDVAQFIEPRVGKVRIKFQARHRLLHKARHHLPVVEPVQGRHLLPSLFELQVSL